MNHIAIMKKEWGLTEKILQGKKSIESRWYKSRRAPWDRIRKGDMVYFKNSGELVSIKAKVRKVMQFSNLTQPKVRRILDRYGAEDGIENKEKNKFYQIFKNRKYCILMFLGNPQRTKPFSVKKSGFGSMSAWISVPNIGMIKKGN